MGAPLGNQNAVKAKRWQQAIDRALAKRSKSDGIAELDRLAEIYLDTAERMATNEDRPSIAGFSDLRDTLDGRPAQQLQLQGDADNPVHTVSKIVREVTLPPSAQLATPKQDPE